MPARIVVSCCIMLLLSAASSKDKKLRRPPNLPPEVIKALDEKMNNHGTAMMWLSLSVVLLEHEDVEKAALSIVNEPRLKKPASTDPLSTLPPRFFELQDELVVRAQALADAGKKKNDAEMGSAYGRMTETCVACHSSYLAAPKK